MFVRITKGMVKDFFAKTRVEEAARVEAEERRLKELEKFKNALRRS